MGLASIADVRAEGVEGVRFTATLEGAAQQFMATREALEDVAYDMLETQDALLAAFKQHEAQVAEVAARLLAAGAGDGPVTLQSLL